MIPNKRKSESFPLDDLKVNKSFNAGDYSVELSKRLGAKIAYYNNTRKPKRFCQRKVKGKILIYREK